MQTSEYLNHNPEREPLIQPTEVYLREARKGLRSYEHVHDINEASRDALSSAESITDIDGRFRVAVIPEYGKKLSIAQVTPWIGGTALNRYRKAKLHGETDEAPVDISDLIAKQLEADRPVVDETKNRNDYSLGA